MSSRLENPIFIAVEDPVGTAHRTLREDPFALAVNNAWPVNVASSGVCCAVLLLAGIATVLGFCSHKKRPTLLAFSTRC
jgi:hypothetical protein